MKRLLPLAALSLVLLSGCAHDPHVAASVDGHDISTHDVNVLSKALCYEQEAAGQGQQVSQAAVRANAVSALIASKVYADLAEEHDLTYQPLQLAKQVGSLDTLIAKLPSEDQKLARTLITGIFRGRLQVENVVVKELQQSGQQPSQADVEQGMQALEQQQAKKLKIRVNPRYDVGTKGDADNASVSKAVSSSAKEALQALRGQTSPTYVASLPSSQRCG